MDEWIENLGKTRNKEKINLEILEQRLNYLNEKEIPFETIVNSNRKDIGFPRTNETKNVMNFIHNSLASGYYFYENNIYVDVFYESFEGGTKDNHYFKISQGRRSRGLLGKMKKEKPFVNITIKFNY